VAPVRPQRGGNSSAAQSLYQGLQVYYNLDEASGGRSAAFQNASLSLTDNNTVTSTTGKLGLAAQFTRANQESLTVADNASLSFGSNTNFTISCWVNFTSLTGGEALIGKWNVFGSGQREYEILYLAGGTQRFQFSVTTNGTTITTVTANNFGAASTSTWYFVVASYDGSNISINVNNGTANTATFTAGVFDGSSNFAIGNDSDGDFMDGLIDMVAVWKRTLSAAELAYLYNSGNGRAPL
jgi:hypothetical protein